MASTPPFRAALWIVTRKELREILRDKRGLFVLLLLPVLLYPVLFIGGLMAMNLQVERLANKKYEVWVEDLEHLPQGLRDRLEAPLVGEEEGKPRRFRVHLVAPPPGADYDRALAHKRAAAVLRRVAPPAAGRHVEVSILFNGSLDTSLFIRHGIERAVSDWRRELVAARLRAEGLSPEVLDPVVARPEDRGPPGAIFARMLSILVVVLALTSAFYPALDLGAGEKERGTLETLLLAPAPRTTLALAKVLATFLIALASAALNLISLGATFASAARFAPAGAQELQIQLGWWVLPVMLVVLVPLVLLFSALSLAISTFAASYKEGQAYLTPLMLVGTLPAMGAALPDVDLTPTLALVPVLGAVLLLKAMLAQVAGGLEVLLVTASSTAYAALGVRWVAALYDREEVLWRPAAAAAPDLLGLSGEERHPLPTLPQAALMSVAALLLFWFVGVPAQSRPGHLAEGLALTLVALIALPALAYARWLGNDLRRTFSLYAPPPLAWPCAVLLAVGCLALNVVYARWLASGGGAIEGTEQMRKLEAELATWSVPLLISLVAMLPALCEELLCRGFVLAGLRSEGGPVGAVVVSAIVFSVLHLDATRLVPTFFLGLVLATLVLRSGSVFPAMLLHFCNNGLALGLAARGGEWGLLDPGGSPTSRLWAVAVPALIGGVALLWGLSREAGERGTAAAADPAL